MTFSFDNVIIPDPKDMGRTFTPNLHIRISSFGATLAQVEAMRAKTGTFSENVVAGGLVSTKGSATLGTLIYDTETFENMRIVRDSFKVLKDEFGICDYEMTLAQDTAE